MPTLKSNPTTTLFPSVFIAVTSGGLIGLLIVGALSGVLPWREPGAPYPFWAHLFSKTGDSFVAVVPGFIAGYIARRAGLSIGAIAGLLIPIALAFISIALSWPAVMESEATTLYFLNNLFAEIISAAITNGVAGLAGEYLGNRAQPSNKNAPKGPAST